MEYSGITTTLIPDVGPAEVLCNYTADYCSDRMKEPEASLQCTDPSPAHTVGQL